MSTAITKNRLSKENIIAICEKAFGRTRILAEIRELSEGFCNAAYDIRFADGGSAILKVAPPAGVKLMSCEVDLMATEVGAMRLAAGKGMTVCRKCIIMMTAWRFAAVPIFLWRSFRGQVTQVCGSTCLRMR